MTLENNYKSQNNLDVKPHCLSGKYWLSGKNKQFFNNFFLKIITVVLGLVIIFKIEKIIFYFFPDSQYFPDRQWGFLMPLVLGLVIIFKIEKIQIYFFHESQHFPSRQWRFLMPLVLGLVNIFKFEKKITFFLTANIFLTGNGGFISQLIWDL